MLNCADIDALVAAIAAPMPDPAFDLTGDEMVDLADRDAWLAAAGAANLASGNSYLCVSPKIERPIANLADLQTTAESCRGRDPTIVSLTIRHAAVRELGCGL